MTLRQLFSAGIGLFLLTCAATRGQSTWAMVPAATTNDLWGVTWGGGQFVAVGQAGTILTSADGTTWTARTSGTTAWLLAVTYSPELKRYVAVGDLGTVLTSTDAVTWTAIASGTTERLNGIATGGGRLLAVGEHSTTLTSTDAVNWTKSQVPVAGWLRGVAYVAGSFLLAGSAYDSTATPMPNYLTIDGQTFTEVPGSPMGHATEAIMTDGSRVVALSDFVALSPATYPLQFTRVYDPPAEPTFRTIFSYARGILLFNDQWVAAGTGGVIFSAPLDGPITQRSLGSVTFTALAANDSTAVAVGSGGAIARSLADAKTPPVLTRNWTSGMTIESVTSGSTVTFAPLVSGAFPMTYQWSLDGQPIPGATNHQLVLTNVQQAQSGRYSLTATNALGTATTSPHAIVVVTPLVTPYPVDPTFSGPYAVSAPVPLGNGDLLVVTAQTFQSQQLVRLDHSGQPRSDFHVYSATSIDSVLPQPDGRILVSDNTGLRRLNGDGTVDPTFAPVAYTPGTTYELLPDGRILGATAHNNTVSFQRFTATGTVDPTYAPKSIVLAPPPTISSVDYSTVILARDTSGYVAAAVSYQGSATAIWGVASTRIFRLGTGGEFVASLGELPMSIVQLVATDDYLYYVTSSAWPLGSIEYSIGRATKAIEQDGTYHTAAAGSTFTTRPVLRPDGGIFAIIQPDVPTDSSRRYTVQSYNPDGTLAQGAQATISAMPHKLYLTSSGELYAFNFYSEPGIPTPINGVNTGGLARLTLNLQPATTRLTNVSVRQVAGMGDATLTLGFCITGQGQRTMLLRGVGPSLTAFGLTNPMPDPQIELWDSTPTRLLANRDWQMAANLQELIAASTRVGAFPLPDGSKDAAGLVDLGAGTYSVQLTGATPEPRVALVEGYDASDAPPTTMADARIVNFSARAKAGVGDGTLILGFNVDGPGLEHLLIRGVGPSLTPFGVTGVLNDPPITVYHGNTIIAWNNDSTVPNSSGAFPLTSSRDAALQLDLPAGSYTVQVNGADGGTGVALLEVYER